MKNSKPTITPEELIKEYKLQPHPEGGYYRESFRSDLIIPKRALPKGFKGDRVSSTAIYFLLEQGNFSAFHRIKSNECWHFYCGEPLHVYVIDHDGSLYTITLGSNITLGQYFHYTVPANCWFASQPAKDSSFSFVGCSVSPGFDFEDFELAKADELAKQYPQHENIIRELCRE
ncbi:MAG: cupin domain-containing protein [Bacteroidetes bacterium]|nr:cupin domain-containing protein [Bacteroidota bacterium]